MKIKRKPGYYLVLIGSALWVVISLAGCMPLHLDFRNPNYIYEDGAVLVGGNDQPIELINNPQAVDVSYQSLMEFIREDVMDQHRYIARGTPGGATPFVCSDFAEEVHNNAEANGIRAGYAGIDFEDGGPGHAVDAFEATDKGIVYIDCNGRSLQNQLEDLGSSPAVASWDKVGYVEIGKAYGVIALDYAKSPQYSFFEQYERKWQVYKEKLTDYNAEVEQFNHEIASKVYRTGTAEHARIQAWEMEIGEKEQTLIALSEEIGDFHFKPLGIVKRVSIHW